MIRLRCPVSSCLTTWVLHPEAVDERVQQVTEHVMAAHREDNWYRARGNVVARNADEIRRAYDDLATANRRDRRPRHDPHRAGTGPRHPG